MRSANFARHQGQPVRPTNTGRYNAPAPERAYARPDQSRVAPRESRGNRRTPYRPQEVGATRYQQQVPRQARNQPRENQRPQHERPAEAHVASRGHAAPAAHPRREDDKRHR